jgi:hypothetical protein
MSRSAFGGSSAGERVEGGKFIAEFEDDSFGSFFSKTFQFGEGGSIPRSHRIPNSLRGASCENGEGGFGPDTGDVMKKEAKEIPFA